MTPLQSIYENLSEPEKGLLFTIVMFHRSINKKEVEELYKFHSEVQVMKIHEVRKCMTYLQELKLLQEVYPHCFIGHPELLDHVLVDHFLNRKDLFNKVCEALENRRGYRVSYLWDEGALYRDFKTFVFRKDVEKAAKMLDQHASEIGTNLTYQFWEIIFEERIPGILDAMQELLPFFATTFVRKCFEGMRPLPDIYFFPEVIRKDIQNHLNFLNIFCGRINAEASKTNPTLQAMEAIFSGNKANGQAILEKLLADFQSHNNTKKKYLPRFSGILLSLLLLTDEQPDFNLLRPLISNGIKLQKETFWEPYYGPLHWLVKYKEQQNRLYDNEKYLHSPDPLVKFLAIICQFLADKDSLAEHEEGIKKFCAKAHENGYHWIAVELNHILAKIDKPGNPHIRNTEITPLTSHFKTKEKWEESLEALLNLEEKKPKASKTETNARILWEVNFEYHQITPIEQKLQKNGNWSKGREITLKRLKETPPEYLTEQDAKVAKSINKYRGYYNYEYDINFGKSLPLLAGHPHLYKRNAREYPIELVLQEPEIMVTREESHFSIQLPEVFFSNQFELIEESLTRYLIIVPNEKQKRIASAIGTQKLKVPLSAKEKLEESIKAISSQITINSDFIQDNIPYVEPENEPFIQVVPLGTGLRGKILTRPLGENSNCFVPGEGHPNVIGVKAGEKVQTRRNLEQEKARVQQLLEKCPTLGEWYDYTDEMDWESPLDCLELLAELKGANVRIEWPEGEKVKLARGKASFHNLKLQVKKQRDWFSFDGTLEANEQLTLSLKKLLNLSSKSSNGFVQLDDGSFLEITKDLRKQLAQLNALSLGEDEVLIHPLAQSAVRDLTEQVAELDTDKHWLEQLKNYDAGQNHKPQVPNSLDAELRPYQQEGFEWMSKLAAWGVGACLADDMGLGKTVQTIALLLERAMQGPALVVAPASVCNNWYNEIRKFAPSLSPVLLHQQKNGDLDHPEAFQVVLASYGLLSTRKELLENQHWNTIVLDEAHAIKNISTQRYKAVMQLQGNFKLLTTGTPIQNHLGELWSLFNFINPGLLGTLEQFTDRFITATSEEEARKKQNHLKQLIRPFILRRTKQQVLDDLPPKTEITLEVEMSQEEKALYEAIRQQAIENLDAKDENGKTNKHMKILAEITRLRQACCHPKMAVKDSLLESSKLALFAQTIEELRENRHRVLVFSQFTSYLKMVKQELNAKGITYQYLDGATPLNERDKRVKAFQAGEGDLFLISLKAGGLGLNLTAADYVIHLDPWWNPAIEDQASDRAHRYGQTRPVTIYRLITKGTIEEKIVKLHHTKKELANTLLEGTDQGQKLSTEELLKILMEG